MDDDLVALIDANRAFAPMPGMIFLMLWAARGRTLTNDFIAEGLWNARAMRPGKHSIVGAVKRARRACEAAGWPVVIEPVYSLGYRMVAPHGWDWEKTA